MSAPLAQNILSGTEPCVSIFERIVTRWSASTDAMSLREEEGAVRVQQAFMAMESRVLQQLLKLRQAL